VHDHVVFASSGAVVSGCKQERRFAALAAGRYAEVPSVPMLTHESPLHPSGIYGASKVWGEALGRHYADAHGLSVICVRIGRVKREDWPQAPREFAVWCSQRDIARFLERCIAAPPTVCFNAFFATLENRCAIATSFTRAGVSAGSGSTGQRTTAKLSLQPHVLQRRGEPRLLHARAEGACQAVPSAPTFASGVRSCWLSAWC
jgi:hypothetical protein